MKKSWIPVQSSLNPLDGFQQDLVVVKGKVLCCQEPFTIFKTISLKVNIKKGDFLGIIPSLRLIYCYGRQIAQMGNGDPGVETVISCSTFSSGISSPTSSFTSRMQA